MSSAKELAKEPFLKVAEHSVERAESKETLSVQSRESARNSYASQTYDEDSLLAELADMNQRIVEEATVMETKDAAKAQEVTIEPPALPERSALRASRLLDSLKLNSIESARQSLTTSHDLYLSSEEDASSFGDDISDYDFESGSESSTEEPAAQSPTRRKSREDTARAVSVVFIGKPCIVNLSGSRGSSSPDLSDSSHRRSILQRRSISLGNGSGSGPGSATVSLERPSHLKRQNSISSVASQKNKPAFLNTDPFADRHYSIDSTAEQQEETAVPRTPRTPTAVLQRFSRSLNLSRKRSRQNLRAGVSRETFATMGPASPSTTSLIIDTNVAPANFQVFEPQSAATVPTQSPATYTDIMRSRRGSLTSNIFTNASATPPPPSPAPTSRKSILGGLNMSRRRSLKTKSAYLP